MGNLFPRVVDKSLMIFEHCKKGSIEDAERLCDQMIDEGGISSILVYNCLVHGFSQQGRI